MGKLFVTVFLFGLLFFSCGSEKENSRISTNINSNWTFNYYPAQEVNTEFTSIDFNDATWPVVSIPHTWQTYETTGDLHPFIKSASERDDPYWWKGWGYYRKHFIIPATLKNKKVTVEFDGVQKYSRIYINGKYIGDHKGGFTSFTFDLTPYIKFGEDNVLAVAVNNRRDDKYRIPPMTAGNWDVYGGIYRDARLVLKNKIYIPYQGSYKHEGGTFVTTPVVNHKEAEVNVKTYVQNDTKNDAAVTLVSTIFSPEGKKVQSMKSTQNVATGELAMFEQRSPRISNPQLWHPNSPNLYHVKSEVFVNNQLTDKMESPLGFRWFRWDYKNNDLYINGEKMQIRGMNHHQEYPWVGDAIPKWLIVQDFTDMKNNLGINFFRAAHYPNDPLVYYLADSLGMVAVEEVPNIKALDFDEGVQKQNVQEMIRRDRNHPSIFFWSMGNETTDAADSKWAIEEDTTRIIHARKAENAGDYVDHNDTNLDMENLLRVTVRGYFDVDNAPKDRDLQPKDGQWCSTEEWQHKMATIEGGSVRGSLKKNTVLWIYEDHGADREYKNSPLKHINYKGWVDLYRFPKYVYYLTQAMWTTKPMVFIHPHNWVPKYLGQKKDFIVDSNCDKVELFVDDKKVGEAFPDYEHYYTVTFPNIEVKEGTLKAVATKDGKKAEYKVAMSSVPARLKLTVSRNKIRAGKGGMAIVTADILNKNGNRVIDAKNPLTWKVEGAAKLIGPKEYKTDFNLFEAMEGTGYIRVPVSNIIRSANQPGKAKITVSSPGLEPASVEIDVVPLHLDNTEIEQPVLTDEGRGKVIRNENYQPSLTRREELKHISGNVKFDSSDKTQLRQDFIAFLQKNNPAFDKNLQESKVFIDYFVDYLTRMKGELVGDDFNFMADKYNDCRLISRAIDESNIWFNLATQLVNESAERIIAKGESVDAEKVAKQFVNLPKTRLILQRNKTANEGDPWIPDEWHREPVSCYFTNLESLIKKAYPAYSKFNAQQKNEYKAYVDLINPEIEWNNNKFIFPDNVLFCLPDPGKIAN